MKHTEKCNYEYCRFNKNKQCVNEEHREQCVELAKLILAEKEV